MLLQAIEFKHAAGCEKVHVLDVGAGSGLLSMMAARQVVLPAAAIKLLGITAGGTPDTIPRMSVRSTGFALC